MTTHDELYPRMLILLTLPMASAVAAVLTAAAAAAAVAAAVAGAGVAAASSSRESRRCLPPPWRHCCRRRVVALPVSFALSCRHVCRCAASRRCRRRMPRCNFLYTVSHGGSAATGTQLTMPTTEVLVKYCPQIMGHLCL